MKKIIMFLSGLMLLVITFITVFFAGALYDTAEKRSIEVYFFQPNRLSYQRPGVPQTPQDLGEDKMCEMMIHRYISEYFYVFPDVADVERRQQKGSALDIMTATNPETHKKEALIQWQSEIVPQLQKMAEAGVLRTVQVTDIQPYGDYQAVRYQLKTWPKSNNMNAEPIITDGTLILDVKCTAEIRQQLEQEENVFRKKLSEGGDAVGAFLFSVYEVMLQ